MSNVIMVLGYPASGKSTHTKKFIEQGYSNLNRDTEGGKIIDLLPKMEELLKAGKDIVLDNLFPTMEIRKPFVELAKKYNAKLNAIHMTTSIEDSQFNFVKRMIELQGKLLTPEEIKKVKHPNIFPPAVFFKYKKEFQKPTASEGFDSVVDEKFLRKMPVDFTGKALILDYDGTLRECVGGNDKYPTDVKHVEIKQNRTAILKDYEARGYKLLGVSNQSGIHKGELTVKRANECFDLTNKLLNVEIEYTYCPHQSNPISCYCRKPMCGWFVHFMMKYKLNPSECYFVGDMTTDRTFARRCGMQYFDQAEFFK